MSVFWRSCYLEFVKLLISSLNHIRVFIKFGKVSSTIASNNSSFILSSFSCTLDSAYVGPFNVIPQIPTLFAFLWSYYLTLLITELFNCIILKFTESPACENSILKPSTEYSFFYCIIQLQNFFIPFYVFHLFIDILFCSYIIFLSLSSSFFSCVSILEHLSKSVYLESPPLSQLSKLC